MDSYVAKDRRNVTTSGNEFLIPGQIYVLKDGKKTPMEYTTSKNDTAPGATAKRIFIGFGAGNDRWMSVPGEKSETRFLAGSDMVFYTQGDPLSKEPPKYAVLARLNYNEGQNIRYIEYNARFGSGNPYDGSALQDKNKVELIFQKEENGLFKITLKEPLSPGEYAFIGPGRFYDFAVDEK